MKRGLSDQQVREKQVGRAIAMANAITDPDKAWRRGKAWENENFHTAASVFWNRAALLLSQKKS